MSDSALENMKLLYSTLNEHRLQGEFFDIYVKVENCTFGCHRIILVSALEYFRNMFCGKYSESKKKEIELKGISADDFELLLTFIYTGNVAINFDNVFGLLKMSHYLGVKRLEELCMKSIRSQTTSHHTLPLDTAASLYFFSIQINNNVMRDYFVDTMAKNFGSVLKYERFLQISASDLRIIFENSNFKRQRDDLSITRNFLMKWLKFRPSERADQLLELLIALGANVTPQEFFMKTWKILLGCSDNSIDKSNPIDNASVDNNEDGKIVSKHVLDDFSEIYEDESFLEQRQIKLPFVLYARGKWREYSTEQNSIRLYSFNSCKRVQLMHTIGFNYQIKNGTSYCDGIELCRSFFVDGFQFLMIIGNLKSCGSSSGLKCLPYFCDNLRQIKLLSSYEFGSGAKDTSLAATASGANIHVYYNHYLCSFNCETNQWVRIFDNGCVKTENPNLLSQGNNLYMIGGTYSPSTLKEPDCLNLIKKSGKVFQHLDEREGKWHQLPKLIYARSKAASCIHNDTLYVSGGEQLAYHRRSIEYFDFKANAWHKFDPPMLEPKMNHTFFAHNNQLWFFGGQKYGSSDRMVEDLTWYSYNLEENTWSDVFTMYEFNGRYQTTRILDVVVEI